jgi:hypothetical protein
MPRMTSVVIHVTTPQDDTFVTVPYTYVINCRGGLLTPFEFVAEVVYETNKAIVEGGVGAVITAIEPIFTPTVMETLRDSDFIERAAAERLVLGMTVADDSPGSRWNVAVRCCADALFPERMNRQLDAANADALIEEVRLREIVRNDWAPELVDMTDEPLDVFLMDLGFDDDGSSATNDAGHQM